MRSGRRKAPRVKNQLGIVVIIELRAEMPVWVVDQRLDCLHFRLARGLGPAIDFACGVVACADVVVQATPIRRTIVSTGRIVLKPPLVAVISIQVDTHRWSATAD